MDWWNALPPEKQAALAAFGADLGKDLAKDLVKGLLKTVGKAAAKPFQTEPRQKALEEALTEALGKAMATLPLRPDLAEHYKTLFGNFLRRKAVQKELSLVIAPQSGVVLNLSLLRDEFTAAGYDADLMPGLDFDRFIATLVSEFYDAAASRAELRGAIEIGLLRALAEGMQNLTGLTQRGVGALERIEDHVRAMRGGFGAAAPQRPSAPIRTRIPQPRAEHFVGRDADFAWVCERLKRGDSAALAGVRGIGGIGKTELAIAVALALEAEFGSRVIWLDCGPRDILSIQEQMAAALGVTLDSDSVQVRADALALAWRHQQPTLVVLDDVRRRHLADFALLEPPHPPCALLVTSRRQDLPVAPAAIRLLNTLESDAAAKLFIHLLRDTCPVSRDAAASVADLLQGVPLALTLAARRAANICGRPNAANADPIAILLDELRERKARVLHQGDRPDLSIVITFDASYDDLDEPDQARLRRLAVFARGEFDLSALAAVWEEDQDAARQATTRLVNAGLLEEIEEDAWWIHDMHREYAAERLRQAGAQEVDRARTAHAGHILLYLRNLKLASVDEWRELGFQLSEIQKATDWAAGEGTQPTLTVELIMEVVQKLAPHLFPGWESWLEAGISAAEAAGMPNAVVLLLQNLGLYLFAQGDPSRAERVLRDCLDRAQNILNAASPEDEREAGLRIIATAQENLATVLSGRMEYDEAERLFRESIRASAELGDTMAIATRQVGLANICLIRRRPDDAETLLRESLRVLEPLGDSTQAAAVNPAILADLLGKLGQYDEAERLMRQSVAVAEALGDSMGVAVSQTGLAILLRSHGHSDEAESLLLESLRMSQTLGNSHQVAIIQFLLADVVYARGQYDEAEPRFRDSLRIFEALGNSQQVAVIQGSLANVLRMRGQYDEAERLFRESIRLCESMGNLYHIPLAQSNLANLLHNRGRLDEAKSLCESGLTVCRRIHDAQGTAVFLLQLGQIALDQGQPDAALPLLQEARQYIVKFQIQWLVDSVNCLLAQAETGPPYSISNLLGEVRAALRGDRTAGGEAWNICAGLVADPETAALGRTLRKLLAGIPLEEAVVDLPEDLRRIIMEALDA